MRPVRGEVWLADLNPTQGREQSGRRPVLVVSVDEFNRGPAQLVCVIPITSTIRAVAWHVVVRPPEGGLKRESAVMCEAVRSVSVERLTTRWGKVTDMTMAQMEDRLRILLRL